MYTYIHKPRTQSGAEATNTKTDMPTSVAGQSRNATIRNASKKKETKEKNKKRTRHKEETKRSVQKKQSNERRATTRQEAEQKRCHCNSNRSAIPTTRRTQAKRMPCEGPKTKRLQCCIQEANKKATQRTPGVRNLLRASSIVNPKSPVYIQEKVRSGIQEFPLQRVLAATPPPAESFVYRKP